MKRTSSQHIAISNHDKMWWQQMLDPISISRDSDPDRHLFDLATKIAQKILKQPLLDCVGSIEESGFPPYCLIENLPIDPQLPEVPIDGKRPSEKTSLVTEGVLLGIAGSLNLLPLAYIQEKNGALVQEIAPVAGKERDLSNAGKAPLEFHTDHAILKRQYRPELLILYGLVNSHKTPTVIAGLDDALSKLAPKYQHILQQEKFRIELPDSVLVWGGKKLLSEWRPLLTIGTDGRPEFAGNLHSVKAMDRESTDAINASIDALNSVAIEIVLEPGNLVIFDNHRCLHARPTVTGDRWLQRLFCRHSLSDLRKVKAAATSSNYSFDLSYLLLE
jgi:L-asparagine oxygenase